MLACLDEESTARVPHDPSRFGALNSCTLELVDGNVIAKIQLALPALNDSREGTMIPKAGR